MDTLTLLTFSVILVLLSTVIFALGYFYSKSLTKLTHAEKQNTFLRFHLQEKSLHKINETKEKSLKIIADATQQAEEIIKKAEILKTDTNQQLQQEMANLTKQQQENFTHVSAELKTAFEEAIKHLEEDDINVFKNVTKDIENVTLQEVKSFENQLHQETVGQQKVVDQKIQEAFAKAQAEIEAYKKEQLDKVDQEMYTILAKMSKDILGKRLTFEDHRELILAAIRRAKVEMNAA